MAEDYSAKNLSVLEGLDAVRKRPGMYIGTTDSQGLMHCLWEIIDNAVDEALAGACSHITVTLHDDGSIEVADNGRGIPVDVEPKTKLTGVEVVLTKLHAGAKFGNDSYNAAGGLHGVGSSVVNALSSRLDVEVDRNGKTYHMAFHQGHPGIYKDANPQQPSPDAPFKRTRKNKPTELEIIGKVSPRTTGTRVRYWADPEIFNDTAEFSYDLLIDRVRQTSFLVPGLKITVVDEHILETGDADVDDLLEVDAESAAADAENVGNAEATAADGATDDDDDDDGFESEIFAPSASAQGDSAPAAAAAPVSVASLVVTQSGGHTHRRVEEFLHTGGVKDFVDYLSHGEPVCGIWHITGSATYNEETQAVDENGELHAQKVTRDCGVDIALRWINGYDTTLRSFVNVVETPGGGMHVDGFLQSLTKQIRKAVEDNARKLKVNLKDASTRVERDDILAGLVAVVTVRIAEPQFQGQTKDVLGTAAVRGIVSRMTDKQFGEMIAGSKRGYKEQSARVLEKITSEMHARIQARKTKEVTRRKNALESASMPPKLSDCQPGNDDVAELFIVEGDSALGTAKAARNSSFQALLPIRGKILNVQKASLAQILANKECAAIIQVVGAGSGPNFDIEQARYNKIVMMTDADVDGAHIRTLLLTLFYRYMRPLIEFGHVYAAVPPLHRIALTGKRKGEYIYTYSDDELAGRLDELTRQHIDFNSEVQRYKGLGEMDADQLADTTMDPRTRMLRRIRMEDAAHASDVFELLMGDEVPPRKQFIIENADDFDRSRIDT
ncbi:MULTISPECIES: DNA gyrase/topoisomerase IV subunit B [Bifidobacterium]|uniref:DNA topoisomerase (ATP-hydrolyzing) n=1 Tax=Bifidobacterium tibiigranuli TaxID=2172043 RepID=A0A5N6S479_9BIFI|nr:DNA topoisomerase IV subunit B [Bifidobacterium tibiigranuli]KAE8128063.1 type IIA DNA topoisomerase subunit B [Bifidobacterium tibiigranuli]KAE8128223.1 DNA topoisomerase IV subunit B [Bifidobacterium tibiigranuli]MCI1211067.1 type IIA DNA topoisomerase subunit B [Bifidobacterium tibiigranuli]MCI1220423.1 type IIA DNA topoisomerase subunit B [Bifidobacterium tibiigranuli]MCI1231894.1 type IIA DNA topoisomerase subunit B [Bifidobacterium tibiigranuli]